jgi:hypothetical protein
MEDPSLKYVVYTCKVLGNDFIVVYETEPLNNNQLDEYLERLKDETEYIYIPILINPLQVPKNPKKEIHSTVNKQFKNLAQQEKREVLNSLIP